MIVYDEESEAPYLAAVIDDFGGQNIYFAWIGQHKKNPYVYSSSDLSEESQMLIKNELYESGDLKVFQLDDYEWFDEYTTIKEFKNQTGKQYRVVQHSALAECGFIIESEIRIYEVDKNGAAGLMSKTHTDKYFVDLIDVNGDETPELLLGDFSSAQLLEISNKSMKKTQALSWSFDGCPC